MDFITVLPGINDLLINRPRFNKKQEYLFALNNLALNAKTEKIKGILKDCLFSIKKRKKGRSRLLKRKKDNVA